jgi:glutaconate CoA-transferase subunit B
MSRMEEASLSSYSMEEAMICYLARELRNHEVIGVGNNSPIPAAAALLAKARHAKQASVYILGQCDWPFQGTKEFFDLMQRGEMDVFFLSGAQIDSYGRINLQTIGDYGKPKVRLPGGAGSGVVYFTCKRIFLFIRFLPSNAPYRTLPRLRLHRPLNRNPNKAQSFSRTTRIS